MSYHVFFEFSTGLAKSMRVPKGTLKYILDNVRETERVMGFEVERREDGGGYWRSTKPANDITDEQYCRTAEAHNDFVRRLYRQMTEWQKSPPMGGERITPKDAQSFWHALRFIDVPPERWTRDYYVDRMEHLYEVMRGRESEGVSFEEKPLTAKQAGAVIWLFAHYLDGSDCRLEVPEGRDRLAASDDGGYEWCSTCGAIDPDDVPHKLRYCRKKKCPLREELGPAEDY